MADINSTLSKESLHELFEYRDGDLYWKVRPSNCVKIGDKVGCFDFHTGYYRVRFNNKLHHNHRLIFLMHHGYLPKMVDHIDCNRSNNKIENLREADQYKNQQNQKISKNSSSGYKNVTWRADRNKWSVRIMANGKYVSGGCFENPEDASKKAIELREKLFGEFANHG
jgi:hypothetical protein